MKNSKSRISLNKPKLSETEQKVLDYISNLDHPADTNEVRDHFNFPLRAHARRIFKKFECLGYGEDKFEKLWGVGKKRHWFWVAGKTYVKLEPPKTEPKKTETPKIEKAKAETSAKA